MTACIVENLSRNYGHVQALQRISFQVRLGEVYGLIGPNGSGKTTTLRIIATLLRPTSGTVTILGYDVVRASDEVRKIISYLPEEAGAYKNLSGYDYLRFMATFYTKDAQTRDSMVARAAEIAALGERLRDKVRTYSKGMTRKLLLARSLMSEPKLAILDEPTSGLDVANAMEIRSCIRDFVARGTAVLLSSHNMLEVEFLSDRVALINRGRIVAKGTPEELKTRYRARNLEEVFLAATK